MWHFILHLIGADNLSGPWYGFWSGIAGDITLFGVAVVGYRKLNCHAEPCWRIGLHKVEGTPYITCKKHHPSVPEKVTAEHIRDAHKKRRNIK